MEEESSLDEPKSDELFQKLRDWQHQQHQRLIEQQQQQRLMLLKQQKELISRINSPESVSEAPLEVGTTSGHKNTNQVLHSLNVPKSQAYTVDDVPLKKPRSIRSFQQILENSLTNKEQERDVQNEQQKSKFPFLKRGQGISRFGAISKPTKKLPSRKSVGKENKVVSVAQQSGNSETLNSKSCKNLPNSTPAENVISRTQSETETETAPNYQMMSFQPTTSIKESNMRDGGEVNSSRSGEDLAVFELLERFATINASFSSSSSLIGQLIDKGVTHLPSPSKVMDFLSHKQQLDTTEEEQTPKITRTNKHVHFSDSLDETPVTGKSDSYSSPFVSNTLVSTIQQFNETDPVPEQSNFSETPLSPIGFPDFQKLFASNLAEKPNFLLNPNLMLNGTFILLVLLDCNK